MALIDSETAFNKRCEELLTGLFEKCKAQSITSFSTLAFSVGSPQNPVSDTEFATFADTIFEQQSTLGTTAVLRRLHFEACTLLVADMKTQSASVDASEPLRKLPFVEKQSRLEAQRKKLNGLLHTSEQQPSHCLIDMAFNIVESGSITYIHPSKCHSREQEIQAEAKGRSKNIFTLEQGALKSSVSSNLTDIDTGTELKLLFALHRRHLAFDIVDFLSWSTCQKWVDKLMTALVSEPLSSFANISMVQILRADREMFSLLAAEHKGSLRGASGDPPPLDATFERLMHDPRINVHLIAMPKSQQTHQPKRSYEQANDKNQPKKPAKQQKTSEKPIPKLPDELTGLTRKTAAGKPMCWHFNLSKGCNNPVRAERCRFGMHHCMKCLKTNHGAWQCKSE